MLKEFVLISSKPNFCASLAYDYNDIVGFCWAYQFESTEEVEKEMNFPGLGNLLSVIDGPMAYLADLAVKPEYRNQGVAKMITRTRADIMLNLGIESVFTRTKSGTSPSVTDIWYDKINIPIIAHYNDLRQRVIRAAKLSDITW